MPRSTKQGPAARAEARRRLAALNADRAARDARIQASVEDALDVEAPVISAREALADAQAALAAAEQSAQARLADIVMQLRDDHLSAGEIAMLLDRSVRDVQGMIRAARSAPIAAPEVEHSVGEPAPAFQGSEVSHV